MGDMEERETGTHPTQQILGLKEFEGTRIARDVTVVVAMPMLRAAIDGLLRDGSSEPDGACSFLGFVLSVGILDGAGGKNRSLSSVFLYFRSQVVVISWRESGPSAPKSEHHRGREDTQICTKMAH